jgi:predicted nucleic acid-binding protein
VLSAISDGTETVVPQVWPLEVANALLKAFRRKILTREELQQYALWFSELSLSIDSDGTNRTFDSVVNLAERYQLTSYDASYLELAKRRGAALATADTNMIQAASAIGVPLFTV